jgi:hypothetical protein
MIFSADETADVGEDDATPVTEEYKAYDNKFTYDARRHSATIEPQLHRVAWACHHSILSRDGASDKPAVHLPRQRLRSTLTIDRKSPS